MVKFILLLFNLFKILYFSINRVETAKTKGKIIVVLKDDVPINVDEFPINLHNYLQTSTCLSASDKNFTMKLRRSLLQNDSRDVGFSIEGMILLGSNRNYVL